MQQIQSPTPTTSTSITWRSAGLFAVRYGIGGVMVLAGIAVLIVVPGDMGMYGFASAIGAGLSVMLLNLLYRLSVSGDREREREEEARRYLDDHGVWPDDDEAQTRTPTRRWVVPQRVVLVEQQVNPPAVQEPSSGERPREAVTPPSKPNKTAAVTVLEHETLDQDEVYRVAGVGADEEHAEDLTEAVSGASDDTDARAPALVGRSEGPQVERKR